MNTVNAQYKQLKNKIFDTGCILSDINDVCKEVSLYWQDDNVDLSITDVIDIEYKILQILNVMDISHKIKASKLIKLYCQLFYLENFINRSCIRNSKVLNMYTSIKELLHIYESGKLRLIIKN